MISWLRVRQKYFEQPDLGAGGRLVRAHDDEHVAVGVATSEPADDVERRVGGRGSTEDQLQRLVFEAEERGQVAFQLVVGAAQRLEDAHAHGHWGRRAAAVPGRPCVDEKPRQRVEADARGRQRHDARGRDGQETVPPEG